MTAVSEAAEWAQNTLETKAKGANVAAFISEGDPDTDKNDSSKLSTSGAPSKSDDASPASSKEDNTDAEAGEDSSESEHEDIDGAPDKVESPTAASDGADIDSGPDKYEPLATAADEADIKTGIPPVPFPDLKKMLGNSAVPKELAQLMTKSGFPPTPPSSRPPSRSEPRIMRSAAASGKTVSKKNKPSAG